MREKESYLQSQAIVINKITILNNQKAINSRCEGLKLNLDPIIKENTSVTEVTAKVNWESNEIDDIKNQILGNLQKSCNKEFLDSVASLLNHKYKECSDLIESNSDKIEECDILKNRCELLAKHVEECEKMNKYMKSELEHYQKLCEEQWKQQEKETKKKK